MTGRPVRFGDLAAADAEVRSAVLAGLSAEDAADLLHDWEFMARAEQLPPPPVATGDVPIWLMLAGRGFGKTRAGAEWVRTIAETVRGARIALVGSTVDEVRRVMVEGASGLLNLGAPEMRPDFFPARRLLRWKETGAAAILYSAEVPDSLRGPEHHAAWGDELAKWPNGEQTLSNLRMGLRLGSHPRLLLTTTPKPSPLLKRLLDDPDVAVTRGATADNRLALPASFLRAMERAYGGTALGRQELGGELIEDVEGALWTRALLERCRVASAPPREAMRRVVLGVDPPAGGRGAASAKCGLVLAALGADDKAYVLADLTVPGGPELWAATVAAAQQVYEVDLVVAEVNNGGDMVGSVLAAAGVTAAPKLVRASRGKSARAEPVATLYGSGKVHHVGTMPELEDELCGLMQGGGYEGPGHSPDRADALVWALTELMLGRPVRPQIRKL